MSLQERIAKKGFDSDDDSDDGNRQLGEESSCGTKVQGFFLQCAVFLRLNGSDIRARKGTYCLGLGACLVVVIITALMLTVMGRLPVLFLRLGEIDTGETDLILRTGGEANEAQSLNYSKVTTNSLLNGNSPRSYHTPRIVFNKEQSATELRALTKCALPDGTVPNPANPADFNRFWFPNANYTTNNTVAPRPGRGANVAADPCPIKVGCPYQHCQQFSAHATQILFIDFAREERMGLGRAWSAPAPGPGEIVLDAGLARRIGVAVGDTVLFQGDIGYRVLQAYIEAELDDWIEAPYTTWGQVIMPLRVSSVVSKSGGKFPETDGDFGLIDIYTALPHVSQFLNPAIPSRKRALFARADVNEMATEVVFNFPPEDRVRMYTHSDAADVLADATLFASPIIAVLGFNQLSVEMPIVSFIQANSFFSLFLGLILSLLIFGLGFLCIVLIHSLLTVGIETRTFELGIMRMVGMTRWQLTGYVVTGALLFAIPAWALGLSIAQLLFLLVQSSLQNTLGVKLSPLLTPDAIGYATLVGISMPLLSSISPIIEVLALDLPRALDTNRSRTQMVTFDIQKPGEYHINWRLTGFGLALAVFGFLIYYLFPLALVQLNITLLFYIFFGILMGMLFGLVLLVTSFQRIVEMGVAYLFLFWENSAVFSLILKNLLAHRKRNQKTSLMFAMSVGFMIFLSVTFNIQIQAVLFRTQRRMGGILHVDSENGFNQNLAVALDRRLQQLATDPVSAVGGLRWTWVTADFNSQYDVSNATVLTVGRYREITPTAVAIAPGFYDAVDLKFLIENEKRLSPYSLSESLYSVEGSSRMIVSSAYKKEMALSSLDEGFVFSVQRNVGNVTVTQRRIAQSEAWLDTSPVVRFSKFRSGGSNVVMSAPALLMRGEGSIPSFESLRMESFTINLDSNGDVGRVADALTTVLAEEGQSASVEVENYLEFEESLNIAVTVVNFFFAFAQIMASIICYFALSSSMSTNIHEQAKEIGILRSIGLRKTPCTRVYIWEGFVLVLASSLLGVVVGVVMGYTIVLQRALFTQLPLPFVFPWLQLAVILGLSLVFGFVSSFAPIRRMLGAKSITAILHKSV